MPLKGLRPAVALVLCIDAEVYELLLQYEWEGGVFSASPESGGMTAAGTIAMRPCVARMTTVCEVKGGRDCRRTSV